MKHTRSSAEWEIREAVVARMRELLPSARIVHELNVASTGSNRIDVAAVSAEHIIAVEIKSAKDKLARLDEQWQAFNACCHLVLVAAHDKHFVDWRSEHWRDDVPSERHLNHPLFLGDRWRRAHYVWPYPRPNRPIAGPWTPVAETWTIPRQFLLGRPKQPRAYNLLDMLWAAELRDECNQHRIANSSRSTREHMIEDLCWHLTGREIAAAVCRQLRGRVMAEADAPIFEVAA